MQIIFRQETRTELQIVVQIKRPSSLESSAESRDSRGFGEFPHTLDTSELALSVLRGHFGTSPRAAAVVVVRGHVCSGGAMVRMLLLLLLAVE